MCNVFQWSSVKTAFTIPPVLIVSVHVKLKSNLLVYLYTCVISLLKEDSQDKVFRVEGDLTLPSPSAPRVSS